MKIYVGNLDFRLKEEELSEVFENYGSVSDVKIITDKFSGRSRGFGFVTMDNDTEGQAAIDALNGSNLNNRDLVVNEARPRKEY